MHTRSKRSPTLCRRKRARHAYAKFDGRQVWFGRYDERIEDRAQATTDDGSKAIALAVGLLAMEQSSSRIRDRVTEGEARSREAR